MNEFDMIRKDIITQANAYKYMVAMIWDKIVGEVMKFHLIKCFDVW